MARETCRCHLHNKPIKTTKWHLSIRYGLSPLIIILEEDTHKLCSLQLHYSISAFHISRCFQKTNKNKTKQIKLLLTSRKLRSSNFEESNNPEFRVICTWQYWRNLILILGLIDNFKTEMFLDEKII